MGARTRERHDRRAYRQRFTQEFLRELLQRYPGCPHREALRIARFACDRRTERVGALSEAGDGYLGEAVELAVLSHLRHRHTPYEALLRHGMRRDEAREVVGPRVRELLCTWLGPRALPREG